MNRAGKNNQTNYLLHCKFSKTTKCTRPILARALLLLVFEKCTRAYLFQIALKIVWLPILTSISSNEITKQPKDFICCHALIACHHSPHCNNKALFISYTITEFYVTSSLALETEDNNIVKLLAISQTINSNYFWQNFKFLKNPRLLGKIKRLRFISLSFFSVLIICTANFGNWRNGTDLLVIC